MLRAGCPRVTHPFAARAPSPKRRASLDLHVLSTPPAFVLSQDQTLREGILIIGRTRVIDTESRCLGDSFNHWSKRADITVCSICTKGISFTITSRCQ